MPLQYTNLLDPRCLSQGESPHPGSVNIPLDELQFRVHELPRPGEELRVIADTELAARTVDVLQQLHRNARLARPDEATLESSRLRLWRPNQWLEKVSTELQGGSALDLACGVGRDSVFLADLGWSVTAVDHLPDALKLGVSLRSRYAPGSSIQWLCSDVTHFQPEQRYDLITNFFFLNRELVRHAIEWLVPGGTFVMETFTMQHFEKVGKPRAAWCLQPQELLNLSSHLEVVGYEEGEHDKGDTARIWARKLA